MVAGLELTQHHLHARFLQDAAGLGAGVVKLGGLADDNGAGADDQNFFDTLYPKALDSASFHQLYKPVKQEARILGASAGLRVELDGKRLQFRIVDALAGAVVGVDKADLRPAVTVSPSTA